LNRINLYFRKPPLGHKWIPGDRYVVDFLRRLFKLKKTSGLEKVFINLCKGLDELKIEYSINQPFKKIRQNEPVVVLGLGKYSLEGYHSPNPIIAGIGLMTHPSEWPDLCKTYPVARYLQHSEWANNVYIPYYGSKICKNWPAGIDSDKWSPDSELPKKFDFLVYNKLRWNHEQKNVDLKNPMLNKLHSSGLSYHEIVYGQYTEKEYFDLLQQCRAMIFLCEHESQGIACCEALSMNVPVFAWDQGYCLDPERFKWNSPIIAATSVPFFDNRCGMKFTDFNDFENTIDTFWDKLNARSFNPREYILENLTLKKSARQMLDIISSVYQ
jgi:glycosyltransferase involved in cell wall biosynthesis